MFWCWVRCSPDRSKSMYFSNFIASKLNVWNSNGRHRLEEFLAKMGFSLEQCKQKYPFMSSQLRKRLRDQIEKYADDYGLQDIFYGEKELRHGRHYFITCTTSYDTWSVLCCTFERRTAIDIASWRATCCLKGGNDQLTHLCLPYCCCMHHWRP